MGLAFAIGVFFAGFSPGWDYFQSYQPLVLQPDQLIPAYGFPWTYNPPWLVPLLAPLVTMPGRMGLIGLIALTLALVLTAARWMEGRPAILLVSAQLGWVLYFGQIEGLVLFGIALGWLALKQQSWRMVFAACLLASLKPQIGAPAILAYLWWIGRDRWKIISGMVAVGILGWAIYGPWPVWLLRGIFGLATSDHYHVWNASIGLAALPLFLPALLLPLDRKARLITLTATTLLVSPYMPFYSTIVLFIFPLPWWTLAFALAGHLVEVFGSQAVWNSLVLFPTTVLLWVYWPFLHHLIKAARGRTRHQVITETWRRTEVA